MLRLVDNNFTFDNTFDDINSLIVIVNKRQTSIKIEDLFKVNNFGSQKIRGYSILQHNPLKIEGVEYDVTFLNEKNETLTITDINQHWFSEDDIEITDDEQQRVLKLIIDSCVVVETKNEIIVDEKINNESSQYERDKKHMIKIGFAEKFFINEPNMRVLHKGNDIKLIELTGNDQFEIIKLKSTSQNNYEFVDSSQKQRKLIVNDETITIE